LLAAVVTLTNKAVVALVDLDQQLLQQAAVVL
jgi:hypothetical protein